MSFLLVHALANRVSSNRLAILMSLKWWAYLGIFISYNLSCILILENLLYFTQSYVWNCFILHTKDLKPYLASNRGKLWNNLRHFLLHLQIDNEEIIRLSNASLTLVLVLTFNVISIIWENPHNIAALLEMKWCHLAHLHVIAWWYHLDKLHVSPWWYHLAKLHVTTYLVVPC